MMVGFAKEEGREDTLSSHALPAPRGLCACPCLAEPVRCHSQPGSIAARGPVEGPPGAGWPRVGQKWGPVSAW